GEFLDRHRLFLFDRMIAPAHRDGILFQIARANFHADRHAFFYPLPIFHAAAEIALVDLYFERKIDVTFAAQLQGERVARLQNFRARVFLRSDREDNDVRGRNPRWQDKSIVITVRHDHRADHARGHAPTRRPAEFLFAFAVLELDSARAREVLSEKM